MTQRHTIHIIAGPTASGKSALALEKAAALNGVIINADSMQVYDALPILTAQPSAEDKRAAPHELYGIYSPNEGCSAGDWRVLAEKTIERVLADGKTPIVTGGSGLYIKSLTNGFSPMPEVPEEIRQQAIDLQARLGNPAFHEALKQLDPVMAGRFHPQHTARLVRAYEVLQATGRSLAEFQALPPLNPPENWVFDITLVMPDRETLRRRCDQRFLWMLENGAVEEIEAYDKACKHGEIGEKALIHRALGAQALQAWLNGEISREQAVKKAQAETRQYAKRQMTWFRNQIKTQKNIAQVRKIG